MISGKGSRSTLCFKDQISFFLVVKIREWKNLDFLLAKPVNRAIPEDVVTEVGGRATETSLLQGPSVAASSSFEAKDFVVKSFRRIKG